MNNSIISPSDMSEVHSHRCKEVKSISLTPTCTNVQLIYSRSIEIIGFSKYIFIWVYMYINIKYIED